MTRPRAALAAICSLALAASPLAAQPVETLYRQVVPEGTLDPAVAGAWGGLCARAGSGSPSDSWRHPAGSSFDLVEVRVEVERFDDPETLEMWGSATEVAMAECPDGSPPAVLFRGLPGALPRSLETAKIGGSTDGVLSIGAYRDLLLGEQSWDLITSGFGDLDGNSRDISVRLRQRSPDEWDQVLELTRGSARGLPRIVWAGDLDADGLPDLWIQNDLGDGAVRFRWYLSSERGQNELVALVSDVSIGPGC